MEDDKKDGVKGPWKLGDWVDLHVGIAAKEEVCGEDFNKSAEHMLLQEIAELNEHENEVFQQIRNTFFYYRRTEVQLDT